MGRFRRALSLEVSAVTAAPATGCGPIASIGQVARTASAAVALGATLAAAGCAGQRLRGRVEEVGQVIETARDRGAEKCAPVELATAEAHHQLAGVELKEGDYYRARAELAIAERAARDAVRFSPRERCADARAGADHDGDGVLDERDECPTVPEDRDGVDDQDGCPEEDADKDGVPDQVDRCPKEPEDRDGFADQDGCPDRDNDGDGLDDRIDQCPDQAEDKDGVDDDDGCPDCDDDQDHVPECPEALDRCPGQPGPPPDGCPTQRVVVTDKRIEIKQPVEFVPGYAVIKPASFGLLDEVARALAGNPTIRIRVEGHTDNQGSDGRNLFLSRARAAVVKRYLMARGVARKRIVSTGYGATRPVAENTTPAGRAQNRRIEFVIIGR